MLKQARRGKTLRIFHSLAVAGSRQSESADGKSEVKWNQISLQGYGMTFLEMEGAQSYGKGYGF